MQIDESHFNGKRKYHRGRRVGNEDIWVFGGIDCTTNKIFLQIVPDRKRQTLIPIIHQRIVEGSTIWSDTFAPYFTLGDEGYTHSMVNHSVESLNLEKG